MTTVSLTLLLILKAVLLISAQKYSFSADKAVQNLIYDAASKRIFVGGTNKIFRLTDELKSPIEKSTGPLPDSIDCYYRNCASINVTTDNVNNILLINKGLLIHCGSVYGGRCSSSEMSTLKDKVYETTSYSRLDKSFWTACASDTFKTLAVAGPGLQNNEGLFVAIEQGYLGKSLGNKYPFLASYFLNEAEPDQMFKRVPNGWGSIQTKADYYYMFKSSSIYFHTVGKKLRDDRPFISRTCIMDVGEGDNVHAKMRYKSYIDIQFNCKGEVGDAHITYTQLLGVITGKLSVNLSLNLKVGGSKGDDVLIAVFYDEATDTSTICPYRVDKLNEKFDEYIKKKKKTRCLHDLCMNGDCSVDEIIELESLGTYSSQNTTSLLLLNIKDDNILVVGTHTGDVMKIVLRSDGITQTVTKIVPTALTKLTASPTVVYAITGKQVDGNRVIGNQVIGTPLGNCTPFGDCESCVAGGDPFCGWCILKAQCMQYSECDTGAGSNFIPELWANALESEDKCFPLTSITPPSARITTITKVEVKSVKLVNALSDRAITCAWVFGGGLVSSTTALLSRGVVVCSSPVLDPSLIPAGTDNILLTVKLVGAEQPFWTLSDDFPLYFCNNNKRCSGCTTSQFDCKWCKNTNTCMHSSDTCGESAKIADEVDPNELLLKSQCPALNPKNYTMEALSDGNLLVSVSNIVMSTVDDYNCLIDTDTDGMVRVPAAPSQTSPDDQIVQCTVPLSKMQITDKPRFLPVVVTYKDVPILNPADSVLLMLYSCLKVGDCSTCKGLDPSFGCTWCLSKSQCTVTTSSACEMSNRVIDNKCSLPGPIINRIYPLNGPLQGGTLLTLEGVDLSIRFSHVLNISVAGIPCDIKESGYKVSTQVSCQTRGVQRPFDGTVILTSVNGQVVFEGNSFLYQEASISKVEPLIVLKTGGTNVTVTGDQLDMGSNQQVSLAGYPCTISLQGTSIVCQTTPVESADGVQVEGKATVTIDKAVYSLRNTPFTYIDVPDVSRVNPVESIADGGINITLTGARGFSAITSAQIYLAVNSDTLVSGKEERVSDSTSCYKAVSDTSLLCNTPKLYNSLDIVDSGRTVNIYWILENTYSAMLQDNTFTVYPNPVIDLDNMDTTFAAGESLVIKGNYFDRVKGIKVFLDDIECQDLDVSDKIISCAVPDLLAPEGDNVVSRRRRAADSDRDKSTIEKSISITVKLGNYVSDPIEAIFIQEVPVEANIIGIVGACVAGGIVVLVLMAAVCLLHKRRLQQKKQFKHLMFHEMEKIEIRLAEECKQVFTELQTDLADLNSDFSPATIPYHSFDEYALKILFPAQEDYPVLHDPPDIDSYEESLTVFEKLVKQEQFLLTLVETLDSQRQVSKRDKSNIAALMIVSLMDDMGYITLILRRLLSKLIEDTVTSDARRVKLLLRRSEHITEKYLSNWLTFNLHSFLIESAGQPLYVIYRAIKQQIEKGPVDYITGNARYALHEKNLLSKITVFNKLNVMVYLDDDPYLKDTAYTPLTSCQVALLSCDTISQAKGKIIDAMYRTVPDSLKPTPNDVDVDLKNGTTSSLRLVDMLHNTQDGWKQLDTLGTLNIDDQAVFQCIPRQSPPPFMSQSGGAPSCNSLLREIDSGRVWHLEREVDTEGDGKGMTGVKTVPEVFLTRLSATKIPLQKFVDDLFNVIFTPNEGITSLPPCIKYLMDFLDSEAARLQINDPEVVHTWKNNALPLRYWISIIKSPDVVFDVRKNNNIDSCLSVIAQTFIDATYYEDMMIDKTSQSSRLLYCKEIPTYKQHVREFYGEIQTCRPVGEADVEAAFTKNKTNTAIRRRSALYELFNYSCRFSEELREALFDKGYTDLADQFHSIADSGLEHSDSTRFDIAKV